jgi:hypothetical protein
MAICLASHGHDDDSKTSSRNKRAHGELAQQRNMRERQRASGERNKIIIL